MNRSVRHIYGPKLCGEAIDFYNNCLLTGSYDIDAQLGCWDITTGKNIRQVTIGEDHDKCMIYSLQVSKTGSNKIIALSGVGRSSCYFYDINSFTPEGIITSITKPVYSLDFSNKNRQLAMSSGDGSIRVFSY